MRKYRCSVCKYVYDESVGLPEKGIPPGTKWESVHDDFNCPLCGAPKSVFLLLDERKPNTSTVVEIDDEHTDEIRELSAGEISAVLSNLAKGCEKQRLSAEAEAFGKVADYYKSKAGVPQDKSLEDISSMLDSDITKGIPEARKAANGASDRGALRSLVWSEKVSIMTKALLERYAREGDAMLANTKIFVCDICGFIYIGSTPPEVCPVCKVPSFKILTVERS